MLTNETLKFISNQIFQEAEPPEDRSRPLEWRRSFKTISFTAQKPIVDYIYSINEVNHFDWVNRSDQDAMNDTEHPVVTCSNDRKLRISCKVAQDTIRDNIFYTEETEKDSGLYRLRSTKDAVQVTLTNAEPTDQQGPYVAGAYAGLTFQTNFEPDEDGFCIEVGVPAQRLEEIADSLIAGTMNTLHISVAIQAFSYEVDDALREWYHPRDMFIHGGAAPTVILSIRLARHEPEPKALSAQMREEEEEKVEPEVSTAQNPTLHTPILDYTILIKSIKVALWAIAGIMLLHLFK